MEAWGFKHYGKDVIISLADNYEKQWEKMTGKFDYNPDSFGMEETIRGMGGIAKDRNECYKYTCKCHGDGTLNNITETIYDVTSYGRNLYINNIPKNALPYCELILDDPEENTPLIGEMWGVKICQLPEHFMQLLAYAMANEVWGQFILVFNVAPRYQLAKFNIIRSGIGGLEHPHYVESYYVLSKHISSNQFNERII